jgi:hypothetical protein
LLEKCAPRVSAGGVRFPSSLAVGFRYLTKDAIAGSPVPFDSEVCIFCGILTGIFKGHWQLVDVMWLWF